MTTVTVACPEAMIDNGNHLAMVIGFGPTDAQTYDKLNRQDADGNLYSAVSFDAIAEWLAAAQTTLTRPSWDAETQIIDMDKANAAQAAMVIWQYTDDETPPQADPDQITVIIGPKARAAIAMMGLIKY